MPLQTRALIKQPIEIEKTFRVTASKVRILRHNPVTHRWSGGPPSRERPHRQGEYQSDPAKQYDRTAKEKEGKHRLTLAYTQTLAVLTTSEPGLTTEPSEVPLNLASVRRACSPKLAEQNRIERYKP